MGPGADPDVSELETGVVLMVTGPLEPGELHATDVVRVTVLPPLIVVMTVGLAQ